MIFSKVCIFTKIYEEVSTKKFIERDIISIGNLAVFIDYYYDKSNWNKLYSTLKKFIKENDKNNFNIIIANGLYRITKKFDIGNCVEYNMNRIKKKYLANKLDEFNLLLDEYDFPNWFKQGMNFIDVDNIDRTSENDIKNKYLYMINDFLINEKINEYTVNYLIKKLIETNNLFEYTCIINACIDDGNVNELCYIVIRFLKTQYNKGFNRALKLNYEDREIIEQKKSLIIKFFGHYDSLYKKKDLNYINFFSNEEHMIINTILEIN